jgi:hypothetical protein
MRRYLASYDEGHDYGTFEFWSDHRANSKANLEDAKRKAISMYGYARGKRMEIIKTELYN